MHSSPVSVHLGTDSSTRRQYQLMSTEACNYEIPLSRVENLSLRTSPTRSYAGVQVNAVFGFCGASTGIVAGVFVISPVARPPLRPEAQARVGAAHPPRSGATPHLFENQHTRFHTRDKNRHPESGSFPQGRGLTRTALRRRVDPRDLC